MSGRSSVSHYSTMSPQRVASMFDVDEDSIEYHGQNLFVHGNGELPEANGEDVADQFFRLARGQGLQSRLAWQDTFRNVRVYEDIEKLEPTVVLDIGCGESHPLGRFVAARELDTYYVGIDFEEDKARLVADEKAPRSFVGVRNDNRAGLPLHDSTVDFVICLAAVTQWCRSYDEFRTFLKHVERVAKPRSRFWLSTPNTGGETLPLQHPHCHEFEMQHDSVLEILESEGFFAETYFNYRARPAEMQRLRRLGGEGVHHQQLFGLPEALRDAIMLPSETWMKPVPGNVLYKLITPAKSSS